MHNKDKSYMYGKVAAGDAQVRRSPLPETQANIYQRLETPVWSYLYTLTKTSSFTHAWIASAPQSFHFSKDRYEFSWPN